MYTQNNSEIMKTYVETFIIEETQALIYDNEQLDKWNEHVSALGLAGQQKIVQKDKSPIPFLWMNSATIRVFETLCPTKVDVAAYDKTPIPVEILDLLVLAKRENYFDLIEIWYNEEDKDPCAVGYKFRAEDLGPAHEWYRKAYAEKYLIGRWADVKQSFKELSIKAKELFLANRTNELKLKIRDAQRELDDLQLKIDRDFGNPELAGMPF